MAEEKNIQPTQEKKPVAKPVKEKVALGTRIVNFFKNYKSELKKIVWSSKEQVVKSTSVVVALIVVAGLVLVVLDVAFNMGITALGKLI